MIRKAKRNAAIKLIKLESHVSTAKNFIIYSAKSIHTPFLIEEFANFQFPILQFA